MRIKGERRFDDDRFYSRILSNRHYERIYFHALFLRRTEDERKIEPEGEGVREGGKEATLSFGARKRLVTSLLTWKGDCPFMRKRRAQAALCIYPSITSHSRDTYSSCPRTRPRVSRLCVHASTRYVSPLVRVRIARPGSLATHMERAMPKRPSRDVGESAGRHIEGSFREEF